jgi:hypothetical protein
MNNKESIIESIEKIKAEYLDNKKNGNNWVALESKTTTLLDIARKILDSNDELIKEIENTLKAIKSEK